MKLLCCRWSGCEARLSWAELLAGKLVLRELQVLHPLAHVDVYKDGSTNLPGVKTQGAENRVQKLFRLAVDQAELVDGRLDWNQQKIRLDGVASGIYVEVGYRAADMHYEVKARVGQVQMHLPEIEPLTLGAEGEFRLYHDRVEVPRLRVNEGHGWVELNGAVTGLASPVAQFTYRAEGDAAEVARLVHYHELKSGAVQLNGQGTYRWDRGEYAVVGQAKAMGVGWADDIVRLEKMNGGFLYSLDREHFNVSSIFATALGGTVHGKMAASHLPGKEAVGQMDLQVTGVELESALRAFASTGASAPKAAAIGFDGRHAAGEVAGQSAGRDDGREPASAAGAASRAAAGDGRGAGDGGLQEPVGAGAQPGCKHSGNASFGAGTAGGKFGFAAGRDDGEAQRTGAAGGFVARQPRQGASGRVCRAGYVPGNSAGQAGVSCSGRVFGTARLYHRGAHTEMGDRGRGGCRRVTLRCRPQAQGGYRCAAGCRRWAGGAHKMGSAGRRGALFGDWREPAQWNFAEGWRDD